MEKGFFRSALFWLLAIGGALIALGALYAVPNTVFYVEYWGYNTLPRTLEIYGFLALGLIVPVVIVWAFVSLVRGKKIKGTE